MILLHLALGVVAVATEDTLTIHDLINDKGDDIYPSSQRSQIDSENTGVETDPNNPFLKALQAGNAGIPVQKEKRMRMSWMSTEIVSGIVEGFMKNEVLKPGEKRCLENNVGGFIGSIVGVIRDTVKSIHTFVHPPNATVLYNNQNARMNLKAKQAALMSNGLDAVAKIGSLITSSTGLFHGCVQGDALKMLNRTAQHMIDIKFLKSRMVDSALDLTHFLADAIVTYEKKQYKAFGHDIGSTVRKVLLDNSTLHSSLPVGVPEETVIRQTTDGLLSGFFGPGSWMEITDAAAPNVNVRLDLHTCISKNRLFFKEIWLAIWNVFAQLSSNIKSHKFSLSPGKGETSRWTGDLMIALMQMPAVLERCNINKDSEEMLGEAIAHIAEIQVHMGLPLDKMGQKDLAASIALSVSSWTNWDFRTFGLTLGGLLRDFLIMLYPRKYALDESGRLRRNVISSDSSAVDPIKSSCVTLVACFSLVLLIVTGISRAIAVGRRRTAMGTDHFEVENMVNAPDDLEAE